MQREGPSGYPLLAQFATAVSNSSQTSFDPKAARANVMTIINELKDRFAAGDREERNFFFDNYPKKVDDIPLEQLDLMKNGFLPKCTLRLSDGNGLSNHQVPELKLYVAYLHTLSKNTYCCALHSARDFMPSRSATPIYPIGGTSAQAGRLYAARADEREVPILAAGSIICLLPDKEALQRGAPMGEHLPFWLAVVLEDEQATVGASPAHL
eukprot:6177926-Pleurochrysis_carterae.AAC.5